MQVLGLDCCNGTFVYLEIQGAYLREDDNYVGSLPK